MFKTSQVIAFKNAIESISTLVQDANLIINPTDGIIIRELSKTGKILVAARFDKENFDSFTFTEPLIIGVDLVALSKCLKSCCSSDIVEVYIGDDITICFKYPRSLKTFKLKSLQLPISQEKIQPIFFDYKICIDSTIFNAWCKSLYNNCDRVMMTTTSNNLVFSGDTDAGTVQFELSAGRELDITTSEDAANSVSGKYDLKFFLLFSKCSGLSDDTIIFVKNGYPLVLQYNLQTLGELKLCLQV
jgi:proliferating cell nuclear antigen PCNA